MTDPRTGEKRKALEALRGTSSTSPDGARMVFWDDGEWHALEPRHAGAHDSSRAAAASSTWRTTTTSTVRTIRSSAGRRDGNAFLASDGWDVWRVNMAGGEPVNLTKDGKARGIRYGRPVITDPRNRNVDMEAPFIITAREERTKKEGILRVDPKGGRLTALDWRDARVNPMKAAQRRRLGGEHQHATRASPTTGRSPGSGDSLRLTDGAPNMNGVAWSPGARLVTYVGEKGDTLQGALFLPAGYEEGKQYPTVTYIYEKMSDNLHNFYAPSFSSSYTPSIYTSRGYAVFMPDIVYEINDPGMSAVWNVVPAVKAAVATGIVDAAKVGLHGHSWGGYQTAFLVRQTNIFTAGVAGAPLTDMVSMYSSVYWNTGSANQPIFESSQGRFKGNFIENREAYERNSPNRYADRIKTPLIILHNDKDGAVDFNQGITFYNTLRQLDKDVILLEYQGENHGLSQLKNRRDYTIRLMEYWDHHLKGLPRPGVAREGGGPARHGQALPRTQGALRDAAEGDHQDDAVTGAPLNHDAHAITRPGFVLARPAAARGLAGRAGCDEAPHDLPRHAAASLGGQLGAQPRRPVAAPHGHHARLGGGEVAVGPVPGRACARG